MLPTLMSLVQVLVSHLNYCHIFRTCLPSFNLIILKSSLYMSTRDYLSGHTNSLLKCVKDFPTVSQGFYSRSLLSAQRYPSYHQLVFKKLLTVNCAFLTDPPSITLVHSVFSSEEYSFPYWFPLVRQHLIIPEDLYQGPPFSEPLT